MNMSDIDLTNPDISQGNEMERKAMTEKMDQWYLDWKKKLLKLRFEYLEEAQQTILQDKQVQAKDCLRLTEEIKIIREMLNRYERTINQKHRTEMNLNKALDFLSKKTMIYHQRVMHIEARCEGFSLSLAKCFHQMTIKRKMFIHWKDLIKQIWKERIELDCTRRSKAIVDGYKLQCKELELQLFNANEVLARLRNEHGESVKQAFMRGICAFNIEAMTVLFHDKSGCKRSSVTHHQCSNGDIRSLRMDSHPKR